MFLSRAPRRPRVLSRLVTLLGLLLALAALGSTACSKNPFASLVPLELDLPRIHAEMERRAAAAVARPEVSKGFDGLFEGAIGDPAASDAGKALLATLSADPSLVAGFEAIQTALGAHPAMKALVTKVMHDNPKAKPDKVGDLVGERVGKAFEGPVFDKGFDLAFEEFLKRPEVASAFDRFGSRVSESPEMKKAIEEAVSGRVSDDRVRDRLIALNGGNAVDKNRATELFLANALTEDRFAKLYLDFVALPSVKKTVAESVRDLAASPAFAKHAATFLQAVVDDAKFRAGVVSALAVMMEDDVTEAKFAAALRETLGVPVVGAAFAKAVDAMMADPELATIGHRAMTRIAQDPEYKKTVASLVEGW